MTLAPVALFVYNRPDHTIKTVEALQNNHLASQTDLVIFSDAAKSQLQQEAVAIVRKFIRGINGFNSVLIVESDRNLGLANSIIDGVTSVCNEYGKVIVLEDDLVTSPFFLKFMNDGLNFYQDIECVASIHGYVYPIEGLQNTFFLRGADCWGWATWKDRWELFEPNGSKLLQQLTEKKLLGRFDFNGAYSFSGMLKAQIDGINNSWAIRWHASTFLLNKLTLYPGKSLVKNIGNDGTGIHCGDIDSYSAEVSNSAINILAIPIEESRQAYMQFERFFGKNSLSLFNRVITKIKSLRLRIFL